MTKIIAMPLMFLFIVASCLTTALPVKAESQTIVVPDQYPTITAALANAHTGDTIYVRNGTYNEHMLIINSTLSLIGEGAGTTIVNCQDSGYLG